MPFPPRWASEYLSVPQPTLREYSTIASGENGRQGAVKEQGNSHIVWSIAIAAILVILGSGVATLTCHFRICSWHDYEFFCFMERECDPIWRDFQFRRIGPGADLSKIATLVKPTHVNRFGDFDCVTWSQGETSYVCTTAYKGNLIEANAGRYGTPLFSKTFLDVQSTEQIGLLELEKSRSILEQIELALKQPPAPRNVNAP